ncbi:hypothetical protein CLHUN_30710 [Ruminiclostridium hungatei]|uniref:Uncharacterized protein n=1 Tax=Ruminiclostridium hungatei TaxID=48256 RepID=A0A1V4SGW1_RUMHU|nr:hypothetical protein [Ruminiclostridium hungatei]OPX43129.1 hypothetical protein CLHUN_30710 [Ruminiclostridium hungatei]
MNQLIKVTEGSNTYSYTYNWDGLRASKTVNGVTINHIWDGDQMVLETDGAGNVTNKYIRGINLIYSGVQIEDISCIMVMVIQCSLPVQSEAA